MVQVFVGGTAPDYAGDSHTTIVALLTKIRDTFTTSGWVIVADTIATTNDFTVRDTTSTIFLRISHENDFVYVEGATDISFATLSSKFSCGRAQDGDDTRLYMNVQDHVVGISCWSNFYNEMNIALAGLPDVFYHPTLVRDVWWVGEVSSTGWMYAECAKWAYDDSAWNSWNVAHSNETTDIRTTGTYSYAGQGSIDVCVGIPYQLDNDVDNDRNSGYFHYNGRENGVDGSSALSPFYWIGGRDDDNGDDGDYGAGDQKRGVNVNKTMFFTGYWENFVRGVASEDQRTIITDTVTGFVYVVGGGFERQGMRIA